MVETDIRRTKTCEKCKAVIPLDRVRLYPKNPQKPGVNMVVCDRCCEELKNIAKGKIASPVSFKDDTIIIKKSAAPTHTEPEKQTRLVPEDPDLSHYICTRCNYKFKFNDDGIIVLRCPYCGKPDSLKPQ